MDMASTKGAFLAPARPRGRCAEHTIEIAAPAEKVWQALADFAGWERWNPLYIRTSGTLVPGREIAFTVAVPGMKPMPGKAIVYRVEPGRLIEYGLVNMGGMLRAFRFVDIAEVAPGRCTVANGEIMAGPVGALVSRLVGGKVRLGMQRMNEELKVLVEGA